MGSTMKPAIFNERVATALRNWHNTAKKHIKQNRGSGFQSPMSTRSITPAHSMSPAHILRPYHSETDTHPTTSPTRLNFETYNPYEAYSPSPSNKVEARATSSSSIYFHEMEMGHLAHDHEQETNKPNCVSVGSGLTQLEIDVQHSDEFSFSKMATNNLK